MATMADQLPGVTTDAMLVHLEILLKTNKSGLHVLFDLAVLHRPEPGRMALPECNSCHVWMCPTYKILLDELIQMGVMRPEAMEQASLK